MIMMHHQRFRLRSARLLPALVAAALPLAGCGGGPEPAPEPALAPALEPGDGQPAGGAPAAPVAAPATSPERAPATEASEPPPSAAPVTITIPTFPRAILTDLREGDVVEVVLTRGGSLRGEIRSLRPRLLVITSDAGRGGGGIVTEHRPEEVVDVRLLHRAGGLVTASEPGPRSEAESWLPAHADGEVLGRDAAALWSGRFGPSAALVVVRELELPALAFAERTRGRPYFASRPTPSSLEVGDEVKLVGSTIGYARGLDGKDYALGEVYLYLARRADRVWCVPSLQRLHTSDLDPKSVALWLATEPATLVVSRPGSADEVVRVTRVAAGTARRYRDHLAHTPARPALRRLRAQGGEALAEGERRVRALYRGLGLTDERALDRPLLVTFTLPTAAEGVLHLLPFSREVGLD